MKLINYFKGRTIRFYLLLSLFVFAAGLRIIGIFHDLPFSFYGDELHFVKRAMAIGAGDLNPHWFHKPAFLMYILTFCYGIFFVLGFFANQFSSVYEFGAYFLQEQGSFLLIGRLIVVSFGVATLFVIYKTTIRISGNFTTAYISTLVAAVLAPMVFSSIVVKADVPAGFFVLLSIYYFLKTEDTKNLKPLLVASLLSGIAMGTKYFGIILLPGFMIAQLLLKYKKRISWSNTLNRMVIIATLFVAGFFIVSPYNFLDPLWGDQLFGSISKKLSLNSGELGYDPDSRISYQLGLSTIPGAFMCLLSKLPHSNFLSWPIVILACTGLLGLLREKKFAKLLILIMPLACYFSIAAFSAPYHVSPRHLNGIFPIVCVLVGLGSLYMTNLFRVEKRFSILVLFIIVCVSILPTTCVTIKGINHRLKRDSRVEAHEWIQNNISKDSVILLDDYGPELPPNQITARRLLAKLNTFTKEDAFTANQKKPLELIAKYPADYGFNIYRLGHQWWHPEELTDEELRNSAKHRDMSNPLVSRVPKQISEYQEMGIQYIVTNSEAQKIYELDEQRRASFPSFDRFYSELKEYKPMYKIDPSTWDGKGPIVLIYNLESF